MKKILAILLLGLVLAPAPWGIALNEDTQECAGYWAGDEYFSYVLPEGWQDYYPDSERIVHTDIGSCQWNGSAESCCQELGYSYVGDIGEQRLGGLTILMLGALVLTGIFVVGVILILVLIAVGGGYLIYRFVKRRRVVEP